PSVCLPSATSTGSVQRPPSRRATQMPTSSFRSRVPPNHAATRPSFVSAMVEAWHDGNGAFSKMNSALTTPGSAAGAVQASSGAAKAAHRTGDGFTGGSSRRGDTPCGPVSRASLRRAGRPLPVPDVYFTGILLRLAGRAAALGDVLL